MFSHLLLFLKTQNHGHFEQLRMKNTYLSHIPTKLAKRFLMLYSTCEDFFYFILLYFNCFLRVEY